MSQKILIADDEPDVLTILRDALEKDYRVVTASNGEEVLRKVISERPDLILLDIIMPELDGDVVNMKLKENPTTANIPVIVITACGHLEKLLDAREELTFAGYLEKPFSNVKLREEIKLVLSSQTK